MWMFQFPSNGKAYPKKSRWLIISPSSHCFNSLQTGKPIQRNCNESWRSRRKPVSIPFKRESLSKAELRQIIDSLARVSIPFKRESLSKVCVRRGMSSGRKSFNSLQTGKPIQRENTDKDGDDKKSFNSLQTGKPIQRTEDRSNC